MTTLGRLILQPGDYYVDGNIRIESGWLTQGSIRVRGNGTARVFVNGSVLLEPRTNFVTEGGAGQSLFVYAVGSITLESDATAEAAIYSANNINLNTDSELIGAATAERGITASNNSQIRYDSGKIAAMDFGGHCVPPPSLSSFTWTVATTTASVCQPLDVTLTARQPDGDVYVDYTGTVNIYATRGHGDFSKGTPAPAGVLTSAGSNVGAATYAFQAADNGQIRLRLSNSHAETLSLVATDPGLGVTGSSAQVVFRENALLLTLDDPLGADVIAGREHRLGLNLWLRDGTGTCARATQYAPASVQFWLERVSGDAGGAAPSINGAALTNVVQSLAISFTAGAGRIPLMPTDVGLFILRARDTTLSFADHSLEATSPTLAVRPFGFHINVPTNPGATSATGTRFKMAGEAFAASVRAVRYSAADDTDNDGRPDGHAGTSSAANLADNLIAASFGNEPVKPQVALSAQLIAPSGGVTPGVSSALGALFSNGTANLTDLRVDDVGAIYLRATPVGTYGGRSIAATASRSGAVGRFYPAYYQLESATFTPACTSADTSFMTQPDQLALSLSARAVGGGITRNYFDSFAKLASVDAAGMRALGGGVSLTPRMLINPLSGGWSAGLLSTQLSAALARGAVPDGPYEPVVVGFAPVDSDGVRLLPAALDLDSDGNGSPDSRRLYQRNYAYGRLRLDSAHGPETAPLPAPLQTEAWDGAAFTRAGFDHCTRLAPGSIQYPGGPLSTAANRNVALGAGTTRGEYTSFTAAGAGFSGGDAGQYFSAPGAGNTGAFDVSVNLAAYPWLAYDWNGDGSYNDNPPAARYSFGQYRGHDRVLFWQEILR